MLSMRFNSIKTLWIECLDDVLDNLFFGFYGLNAFDDKHHCSLNMVYEYFFFFKKFMLP